MSERLWTKDFIIDVVINFLLYVIMYQLMLWSTQFAIYSWKSTVSEAGLASGIFIIGTLLARIVVGHGIDHWGRKKLLVLGSVLYTAAVPFYFLANSLATFLCVRILHGMSYGITATAASTIVGVLVPLHRRGEGSGYYALGNTLASAVGPFLGITLCSNGNYSLNLYVCLLLSIITLGLAIGIHAPGHIAALTDTQAVSSWHWSSFFCTQSLPISIIAFFCGICYSTVLSFIGAYSQSVGLLLGGSIFFCTYAITSFFSRPLIGRFLDHHGGNAVMYPTLIILGLCMVTVSLAFHPLLFALGGILLGLSYSTVTSSGQALAIHGVAEEHIGLATSTFFVFADLGVGIGPYVLGSLVPMYGFSSVYIGGAVTAGISIPLYYLLIGRSGVFSYAQMERVRNNSEKQ